MTRFVLVAYVLMSLLSGTAAQAAIADIQPIGAESVTPELTPELEESVPPCHRQVMVDDTLEPDTSKMPCCADLDTCSCDGVCQTGACIFVQFFALLLLSIRLMFLAS